MSQKANHQVGFRQGGWGGKEKQEIEGKVEKTFRLLFLPDILALVQLRVSVSLYGFPQLSLSSDPSYTMSEGWRQHLSAFALSSP